MRAAHVPAKRLAVREDLAALFALNKSFAAFLHLGSLLHHLAVVALALPALAEVWLVDRPWWSLGFVAQLLRGELCALLRLRFLRVDAFIPLGLGKALVHGSICFLLRRTQVHLDLVRL